MSLYVEMSDLLFENSFQLAIKQEKLDNTDMTLHIAA